MVNQANSKIHGLTDLLSFLGSLSLLWMALAVAGMAQFLPTGTVIGTVKDPTGRVVPQASVVLVNTATGVSRSTMSNALGYYHFPSILPGPYRVEVTHAGFKGFEQPCTVQATLPTTVDATLQVGSTKLTVTVSSQPPLLNTRTGSLGTTLTTNLIQNLPLNGRDPLMLEYMTPGVNWSWTNNGTFGGTVNRTNNGTPDGYFSSNGSWAPDNGFWLDGSQANISDRPAYGPNVDEIQEVVVQNNAYDAQYGFSAGAEVLMVSKSGTNQVHGTAYEYLENTALNANSFFSNLDGLPKTPEHYDEFGGSIGGPIRRDRVFWFFNYEGSRTSSATTDIGTVPTAAQRAGDFSQTFDQAGQLIQIYNPFATVANPAQPGTYIRPQFTDNMIPASMIDIASKGVLSALPMPDTAGIALTGQNNYVKNVVTTDPYNSYDGRVDENIGVKNHLFERFSDQQYTPRSSTFLIPPSYGPQFTINTELGWTSSLSPSTVLDANIAFQRQGGRPTAPIVNMANYGFAQNVSITAPYFPEFNFAEDASSFGNNGGTSFCAEYTWSGNVNLGYAHGRHDLRAGFQTVVKLNNNGTPNMQPFYYFDRGMTQGPNPITVGSNIGDTIASFLLGTMNNNGYDESVSTTAARAPYYGAYVQDDIRVSPKLTLDLGLRWEVFETATERHNQQNAGFSLTDPNPIQAQAQANYAAIYPTLPAALQVLPPSDFKVLGGLLFSSPSNRRWGTTYWPDFSPRFGFAYNLGHNTVMRGGFGMFRGLWWMMFNSTNGYTVDTPIVGSVNSLTPTNLLNNPLPSGFLTPTGSSEGLATLLGTSLTYDDQNDFPMTYSRWNFGIQHAFSTNVTLEVDYVGSTAFHLPYGSGGLSTTPAAPAEQDRSFEWIPPQYLSLGSQLDTSVPNPFQGLIPASTAVGGPTIPMDQLLATYPEFTGIEAARDPGGKSYYDALQVSLTKRTSHGLTLLTNYTFSHQEEATRFLNPSDPFPITEDGVYDAPNRFNLGGTYVLPIGPGQSFGPKSGLGGKLIGGWHAGFNYMYQSGYDMLLTSPVIWTGIDPTLSPSERSVYDWFNKAAFIPEPNFTLRTTPWSLGNMRADAISNLDTSLMKDTKLRENMTLQFRWDMFNALNRFQYGQPNVNPTSSGYGEVTSQANVPREMQLSLRLTF